MKKVFITIVSLASIFLSACQTASAPVDTQTDSTAAEGQTVSTSSGLTVLTAESFLADIAQNVAGDRLTVQSLIPIGVDPHGFEPTPQDVISINQSDVLIVNGAGFETWLQEIIDNAGGQAAVIEASSGLTSRTAREGEEAEMSTEEKADQVCTTLADAANGTEIQAGQDEGQAARLPDGGENASLLTLKLNAQEDGRYGGYFTWSLDEDSEYTFAAPSGDLTVQTSDGSMVEIEDTLPVDCSGMAQALTADMEPGEYQIILRGFGDDTISFFAGEMGEHHHHDGDPHFWLDPTKTITYVENIRDGLIAADPDGTDTYTQNAAAYIQQLNDLDAWIQEQVDTIPEERRLLVTNHESFGYYADRYGFTVVGTVVPSVSSNASPSAQQLARLIDRIKETNAIAIFLETGTNPQLAEQVSAETGVKVVTDLYTHSISEPDGDAPTYIDMLKYNTNVIVNALK